jgi:hypothetical protein
MTIEINTLHEKLKLMEEALDQANYVEQSLPRVAEILRLLVILVHEKTPENWIYSRTK